MREEREGEKKIEGERRKRKRNEGEEGGRKSEGLKFPIDS